MLINFGLGNIKGNTTCKTQASMGRK